MRTSQADQQVFVGEFPDFNNPTVLIWGSSVALKRLAGWLRELSRKRTGSTIFADLAWIRPVRNTEIRLELTAHGTGMQRIGADNPPRFRWAISRNDARRFARQIESLAASDGPGHHYLDSQGEDKFMVVVSKGEYDGLDREIARLN